MILYIGQYRGGSDGWSIAAKNYLKALQATGFDVSSRPIFMNNCKTPDGQIWDTEKPVTEKPKIVIQNVIPDYFEYMPGYNIGITSTETKRLNHNMWIYKINLLDELWVNSESEKISLKDSGVTIKISVIPMPIDTGYLEGNLDNIETMAIPEIKGQYIFYFMGDHNHRSNVHNLIRAFNLEFNSYDDVSLILNIGIPGQNQQQSQQTINEEIKQIKSHMRIHGNITSYPREVVITQGLTDDQVLSLHKAGNCFVSASYGESISIHALNAVYLNNHVICTQGTHLESVLGSTCTSAKSNEIPIVTDRPPLPHIYTTHETWMEPNIKDLGQAMRNAYELKLGHNSLQNTGKNYILNNFSYRAVANKIKENLSWAL